MHPSNHSVTATELAKHVAHILAQVERNREIVKITRFGKPIVQIVPVQPSMGNIIHDIFGCMENTAETKGSLFTTGESWEAENG